MPRDGKGRVKKEAVDIDSKKIDAIFSSVDQGTVDELLPVEPAVAPGIRKIVGRCRCAAIDTEVNIAEEKSGPRLRTVGWFGSVEYPLESLGQGAWQAKLRGALPWGGVLSFDEDGTSFRFFTYNNRAPYFKQDA